MLTVGDQCEPIDPDGYGSNAYLSSRYCDYKIPVQVIHRLLDEDFHKRHKQEFQCCISEPDHTYDGEILIHEVGLLHRGIAFGKWAVPKLKKELSSSDNMLVSKALVSLIELSYNPERSVDMICQNVIARLGKLIDRDSPFIRQKVAILLRGIMGAPYGACHIAQNKYLLRKILDGVSDSEDRVRHEYLRAIHEMLSTNLVYPELLAAGYLDSLIARLSKEKHEPCLLHVIHSLENFAHTSSKYRGIQIKANVIENIQELLRSDLDQFSDQIKIGLLGILAQLMKNLEGKDRFSPDLFDYVTRIVLHHSVEKISFELLTHAIRILTFATITTENKRLLLGSGLTEQLMKKLVDFVHHEDKFLQLSAIYLLTVISETQSGRNYMQPNIWRLQEARKLNGDRDDMGRALNILIKVIQWTP